MPKFLIDLSEPTFKRDLGAAKKRHPSVISDLTALFQVLENDHTRGDWIPGLNAQVRKVRVGVKQSNIGKSNGYRLIYVVEEDKGVIRPLFFHFKPEIEMVSHEMILKTLSAINDREAPTPPLNVSPEQMN